MFDVDDIRDWRGLPVVDKDGGKIGKLGLGQGRHVLLGGLAHLGVQHRTMQVSRQCRLEDGRIYVIVINFAALPIMLGFG